MSPPVHLTFGGLFDVPGLVHAATTRAGGASRGHLASLNLGRGVGDEPEAVEENRRRAAGALGFERIETPRQVHGREVVEVRAPLAHPPTCDALATDTPGLLLGVLGADCPGVLLVDPRQRALAVVHAGWRGTLGGIIGGTVAFLAARYGSRAADLRAGIGPGISGARYAVGVEVRDAARGVLPDPAAALREADDGTWRLDLADALTQQLRAAGLPPDSIARMGLCTYGETERFFSHRRDAGRTGRHALLAGWAA